MAVSLIRNYLSLSSAEVFCKLITFAAFAYLARIYGPEGYGYIEWVGAVVMSASLIVDQGFSAYGVREIAKDPGKSHQLVSEIVTARLLFAGVSYLAIAIFAFQFSEQPWLTQLLLVYGLSLWFLPFLLQWVFQGHDKMGLVARAQIIRQVIFGAVVFIFVRNADDLIVVGIAESAAVFCAAAFTVWIYFRKFKFEFKFRPAFSTKLLKEGLPIGLSQMFWVVKMFGAVFIIGLIASAEETGYFAGAMRIYIALHTFVWLYFSNLLPTMSREWANEKAGFERIIQRSMRVVLILSLIGGAIWIAAAGFAMKLAYGASFSEGTGALRWLAVACIAAAISGHYRFGLVAAGFQSKEMFASGIGAAAAVFLIVIGYLNAGIGGAAAGLAISEALVLIVVWLISKRVLFQSKAID